MSGSKVKTHKWSEVRDKNLTQEQRQRSRAWVEQEIVEMNLRAMRELTGKTQEEVAEILDATQSELSRTERRTDHRLSTLRRYVEALGGQLQILAVFDDKQVRLKGV